MSHKAWAFMHRAAKHACDHPFRAQMNTAIQAERIVASDRHAYGAEWEAIEEAHSHNIQDLVKCIQKRSHEVREDPAVQLNRMKEKPRMQAKRKGRYAENTVPSKLGVYDSIVTKVGGCGTPGVLDPASPCTSLDQIFSQV